MDRVRTVPTIPKPEIKKKREVYPEFEVYGRGDVKYFAGLLKFVESDNGIPSGYTFEPTNDQYTSAETLRQIADLIDDANAAVKDGRL